MLRPLKFLSRDPTVTCRHVTAGLTRMSANTSSAPPAVLSGQQAQALSANMAAVSAAVNAAAGQSTLLSPGGGLLPVCFET